MASVNLSVLLSRGRELKTSFDRLEPDLAPGDALLFEIEAWLKECVAYGRFLSDPSPDRRALQSRVDFWTSLLARSNHPLPDIDRIADFDPEAGSPLEVDFPYPGLVAYSEKQQGLFCGREHDTMLYSAHLEQHPALLLVSESGGGKSSLAMAGILPKLKETHPEWLFATRMTPGSHPIKALSSVLREALPKLPADFLQDGATQGRASAKLVLDTLDRRMLLIFVDQLEELLTLCNDAQQQEDFSALLSALAEGGNCRLLATMRSDHQHQLANSQACRPLFVLLAAHESVKTLAPLDFDQIRTAILKPAQAVGLRFVPPEIVDELARQTANLVGGLPLLQFALWRLWESRPKVDGRPLDLINDRQLQTLPSVQGALGTVAEAQYQQLRPVGQAVCKRLMMELTIPAENYEDPMRRRRRKSEVVEVLLTYGQDEIPEDEKLDEVDISDLINRFVDARLLVQSGDGENTQIEVAHESIFRNWSTFREWVSGEDAKARLQAVRLIAREAVQWADHGQGDDYLKQKGEPLARALDYAKAGWLVDPAVTHYLEACRLEEKKEKEQQQQLEQEKKRAQQAEIEKEKAKTKIVVMSAVFMICLFITLAYNNHKNALTKQQQQKDAALNSLPLLAASLPPGEALAVVQSATKKGGEDFRYVLAHALERMDGTQLLSEPRNSTVNFVDQGTALFYVDKSNDTDIRLKVFRMCDTGMVDRVPAEVSLRPHQRLKVGVGPPSPKGDRILVTVVQNAQSLHLEAYLLSWPGSLPCKSEGPAAPILISQEPIEDANEFSSIAFDAEGRSAVFSALRYQPNESTPPQSTVYQLLQQDSKDWKLKQLKIKTVGESPSESAVKAVAFIGGKGGEPVEARLITGRLNGAIYCGSKPLHSKDDKEDPDPSPVHQIASRLDAENSGWFAYQQQSGRVAARRCEEGEPSIFLSSGKNVSHVNLHYSQASPAIPLVTYVANRELHCWTLGSTGRRNRAMWQERACNAAHPVDKIAISPDARHVITIEDGRQVAIHRFPLQFLTNTEKYLAGRLSANRLILWNTGVDLFT